MTEIISVDQGTTSTKAALVDEDGATSACVAVPVKRTFPRPGWVEQDPVELWQSVREAIAQLRAGGASGLALSSQRESVIVWDRRDGRPLTPCVSWQCARGATICRELERAGAEQRVRELTGLPLDPMFSASKLRSLLDSSSTLRAAAETGEACAGTVDSWLLWQLTAGELHVTDLGNASRTLLVDIARRDWSEELLGLFDIPRACLPQIVASSGPIGKVRADDLPPVIIGASMGDSHAAAYGLGCTQRGAAKATYGTGTSLLAPTGELAPTSEHGLAGTIAWSTRGSATYALEGNIFSSGATVEWMADMLGLANAEELERLAADAPDAAGVHIVPAFAGLGAPYWRRDVRASISGLSFATERIHLARAAIESIALQVADLVHALESDLNQPIAELRVDGGASRNDPLMQCQADLLDRPVARLADANAAVRGVALVAASAVGTPMEGVPDGGPSWTRFVPSLAEDERAERLAAWHAAVARTVELREQVVT